MNLKGSQLFLLILLCGSLEVYSNDNNIQDANIMQGVKVSTTTTAASCPIGMRPSRRGLCVTIKYR